MSNAPTVADNGDRLRARFALRHKGHYGTSYKSSVTFDVLGGTGTSNVN